MESTEFPPPERITSGAATEIPTALTAGWHTIGFGAWRTGAGGVDLTVLWDLDAAHPGTVTYAGQGADYTPPSAGATCTLGAGYAGATPAPADLGIANAVAVNFNPPSAALLAAMTANPSAVRILTPDGVPEDWVYAEASQVWLPGQTISRGGLTAVLTQVGTTTLDTTF